MVNLMEDPGRGPCRALWRTTIYRFSTLRDLLDPAIVDSIVNMDLLDTNYLSHWRHGFGNVVRGARQRRTAAAEKVTAVNLAKFLTWMSS